MELNMSELDNNYNSGNYWDIEQIDNQQNKESNIKKKVSFNDILSNMNLVVNKQGVLQMMRPINDTFQNSMYDYNYQTQNQYQQNQYQQNQYQQNQYSTQSIPNKNEPIDPSVKHSYIYNKYFKDYNNQNIEKPGPRVPKSIEEYKQMLLEDKIKAIQHKILIEQIKPKKMMFTSNPTMSINKIDINASKNNLRKLNFR
jgi:hypothetical protein